MQFPGLARFRRRPVACAVIASLALLAVAGAANHSAAAEKIPVEGTDRHLMQWSEGEISVNDICPVLLKKLGPRRPIWVNGQPVGFC